MEESQTYRHDLDEECNICAFNNCTDNEYPCSLCENNVKANQYDNQYRNYYKKIKP